MSDSISTKGNSNLYALGPAREISPRVALSKPIMNIAMAIASMG